MIRLADLWQLSLRLQGRADARQAAGRSGLDKGTLAAALLGLERAGQRPPDRRTAYGPPPLIKPAALFAWRWPPRPSSPQRRHRSVGRRRVDEREARRGREKEGHSPLLGGSLARCL